MNLPDQDYETLRRLAEERGEQFSDLLRNAVRAYVSGHGAPRSLSFLGAGASGTTDTSLRFEDVLAEVMESEGGSWR